MPGWILSLCDKPVAQQGTASWFVSGCSSCNPIPFPASQHLPSMSPFPALSQLLESARERCCPLIPTLSCFGIT